MFDFGYGKANVKQVKSEKLQKFRVIALYISGLSPIVIYPVCRRNTKHE